MIVHTKTIKLKTVDSTHLYAQRLINSKLVNQYLDLSCESGSCVIVTEEQTAGIGRCNRNWISLNGNLFASVVRKVPNDTDFGKLSLTIACAVRETIVGAVDFYNKSESDFDESDIKLHWPNDVYYRGGKVSGVLISISGDYLIISVGINTNCGPDVSTYTCGACLKEITRTVDNVSTELVVSILQEKIESWLFYLNDKGFSCIKSYWLENISEINCNVIIKNGADSISGFFSDIDDYGRIVLNRNGRQVFISSGDLFKNQEGIITQYE